MIRRPPRSTLDRSSAASDVYKRQYWHSQDKDHFEFPAPAFVKNRITYVCANYPLCPGVSFSEQMHSCRKLLSFLTENIHQYVDAPKGFQLSGHSAGGQIAAMLASTNWIKEGFPTVPQIDSVLALSGIYDLNPILFLEKNKEIRLNQDCLLYTSPSPRDATLSRMPSSA